jgi:hypothetical protein
VHDTLRMTEPDLAQAWQYAREVFSAATEASLDETQTLCNLVFELVAEIRRLQAFRDTAV